MFIWKVVNRSLFALSFTNAIFKVALTTMRSGSDWFFESRMPKDVLVERTKSSRSRRRRLRSAFRKGYSLQSHSYLPHNQRLRYKPQTCFEGPFGEVIRATGPMAKANPVRFSTKYQDDETDLLYYGYRFYNASTGRWLSRDPIRERGGCNLYALLGNDPIDRVDRLG